MKLAATVALATLSSLAAQAGAAPSYTVIDLGAAGASSQGMSISSSGNYALGRSVVTGGAPAFVWSAATGTRSDWAMPTSPTRAYGPNTVDVSGVNNLGVAVATLGATSGGATPLPAMWSASTGTVTYLNMPGGYTLGRVADINDSGIAVGGAGPNTTNLVPVLYDTRTNTSRQITATAGSAYMVTPQNINNAGLVIGTGLAAPGSSTQVALVYDSMADTMTRIDLSAISSSTTVALYGESENGWVVGAIGGTTAFRWSAATGAQVIPLPAGVTNGFVTPYAINSDGAVVGKASAGNTSFYFDGTSSYTLNSLLADNAAGWSLTNTSATAYGLADNGSIIVTGTNSAGVVHALVLASAVPEPASGALMLAGLAGAALLARRRRH
ncbi:PEP-CTERM sorting domain-containing protein [Pelomonas sp. KK5]|uniref:PEP-CTERM sorting domain-containing protein n=1 Tax=Pelomonas sp. KK5 TaxID=1855730 RepID=UPI00097C5C68|nr:PEP-CTERM sorting domain-containing protein [Pelomonas sp. KK5]